MLKIWWIHNPDRLPWLLCVSNAAIMIVSSDITLYLSLEIVTIGARKVAGGKGGSSRTFEVPYLRLNTKWRLNLWCIEPGSMEPRASLLGHFFTMRTSVCRLESAFWWKDYHEVYLRQSQKLVTSSTFCWATVPGLSIFTFCNVISEHGAPIQSLILALETFESSMRIWKVLWLSSCLVQFSSSSSILLIMPVWYTIWERRRR